MRTHHYLCIFLSCLLSACVTTGTSGNNSDQPKGSSAREMVLFQMPSYMATNMCRVDQFRECMNIPQTQCFETIKRYAADCGENAIPPGMRYVSQQDIPIFAERYGRCIFASHLATVGQEGINSSQCQPFVPK